MSADSISVLKIRGLLLVTIPPDPDDATIGALQVRTLEKMEEYQQEITAVILDISTVDTLDSFFARTIAETAQMISLMGGNTVISGMSPAVAISATQFGLTVGTARTALNVDHALSLLGDGLPPTVSPTDDD